MIKLNEHQRASIAIGAVLLALYLAFGAPWARFTGKPPRQDGIERTGLISSPKSEFRERFELAMGQTILEACAIVLLTAGAVVVLGTGKPGNTPPVDSPPPPDE